ncbi:porin family protein [Mesonia sp.]|uniref:porin family protein n=1 Tax=Mesonia sp. TaxID=1960830 RepID=UPI00176E8AAD|nr:porin family protein [Mesonia sp.]HIB36971.1 PorT family protein [Mesonia sp.]HIO26358.1 PorT family protein [Flavobacteriaceae bacterium]
MKKVILSSLLGLFAIIGAKAQADSDLVQIGVKGGVNFANLTGDDIGDTKTRTSFNAGFVAEIPISERFSIQPEVLYSGQGFDIEEIDQNNEFDTDDNVEAQLDYIQIPLLAKIYLVKGLNIQAGPQIGFLINEEIDYQPTDDAGDIDTDVAEDIDFSLAAGVEYKFDGGFFLQGRYNYGFTNVFKESDLFGDPDIKNSVFQVGVGFMF